MKRQKDHIAPPGLPLKLLRVLIKNEYLEEIEGDMQERFEDNLNAFSSNTARLLYACDTIKLLRPSFIKNLGGDLQLNHYGMLKNFIKIGYRNLIRQKEYSILNIIGLTMGLVMTLLTSLWIWDELSFDKQHQNVDQIAQVLKRRTHNGETGIRFSLPIPVVDELRNAYTEDIKYVVVTDWIGKNTLSNNHKNLKVSGTYMSEEAPAMLSLKMLKGTTNALSNKYGILLSKSTAEAFFDDKDPMGEPIKVNGEASMQVVGVYEDLPLNSTFQNLKFIANFAVVESSAWVQRARKEKYWGANFCQIFVQLHESADMSIVEEKIRHMISQHANNEQLKASNPELVLHSMKDWYLRSSWKNGIQSGGAITNVWVFGSVALFVLILSCINFINLTTARAQVRFKEVGIRKTMGSRRTQLIAQFIIESFLVVALAFLIALAVTYLLMPFFNNFTGKNLILPWLNPTFWTMSLAILLLTALLAGIYPAFIISSLRPINALKGALTTRSSSEYLRNGLVVVQFAISVCLVIGTVVINNQVLHTKNRDKGYDPTRLITLGTNEKDFHGKHDILHNALMSTGVVNAMSQSSSPMTEVVSSTSDFSWVNKDPNITTNFVTKWVTPEFGKTIHWKILEGRDFMAERHIDKKAIVCNQAAIDFMQIENPIGNTIKWRDEPYKIIGVVENLLIESPFQPVKPAVYFLDASRAEHMLIRLTGSVNTEDAMAKVEEVFRSIVPNVPFDFQYVDDVFARKFIQEERLGTLLGILTMAAIIIGFIGILGLSAYLVRQRSKELSIRKVLGASWITILSLLLSDFFKIIITALAISVPLAWYLLNNWLEGYEYRINLSIWYFVLTGVFSIVLTFLLVGQRSLRVAMSNPTKFLKEE